MTGGIETKTVTVIWQGHEAEIAFRHRPAGPITVLYLHGLGCSKDDFAAAFSHPDFTPYTLVAFDFPGFGESGYSDTEPAMEDLAEITHLVVESLRLAPPVIVGHSMGGLVALLYLHKYPASGFINVEGNLTPEDCFISRTVMGMTWEEFRDTFFAKLKEASSKSANRGMQECAATLARYPCEKAFYDCSHSLVAYSDGGNLLDQFVSLKIPKLFIHGRENRSLSYLPLLEKSGCPVVEISESGHFPGYDNPEKY